MFDENEDCHDSGDDYIFKGGLTEQEDERHEGSAGEGAERNITPSPDCKKKYGDSHEDCQGIQGQEDAQCGRNAFAAFKFEVNGEEMTDKRRQADEGDEKGCFPPPDGEEDGHEALKHITEEGNHAQLFTGRPHDVRGADVA